MRFGPLVSAGWLREHIGDPDVRVIDFRWYLAGRAQGALPDGKGRDEYLRGHIPGALFVDLEAVTGTRGGGRHPLPAAWQVQDEMQKAGVDDGTKVIAYDDAGGSVAARLWFLLDWFGHGAQAVVDGGVAGEHPAGQDGAGGYHHHRRQDQLDCLGDRLGRQLRYFCGSLSKDRLQPAAQK